jgi:hypothetical protein
MGRVDLRVAGRVAFGDSVRQSGCQRRTPLERACRVRQG